MLTYNQQRKTVMHIARVPLRRINDTLRVTLPPKFVRELGLSAGDYVDLFRDNGSLKLRFVKVEPLVVQEVDAEMEPAE
jgi:anaerobic selenocysteine-containing dehydrogenase